MCGISGFYSRKNLFSQTDMERMNRALRHRGPDAEGYFLDDTAGLSHSRLKILDLSDKAAQPMRSHNGRYIITYNGEVYNYAEIAEYLKKVNPAIHFRSSSDTEVILEAFALWGPEFIHQLNGMFALAIYDSHGKELYVFRDRIGIKPLYYCFTNGNFIFASDLKALLELPSQNFSPDPRAIVNFLHLGYIPSPLSIYREVKKLEPGNFIRVNDKGMECQRYWNLSQCISSEINNEEEALVSLRSLVERSVRYQLISDVPSGIFLSGGTDSSLIAAIAAKLGAEKPATFSIGFEESSHNEAIYAKKVSEALGTRHHELILSYKDAINLITGELFNAYSEPLADSSCIPTMMLARFAKQQVTVALSGEGGDELFFGYGFYAWARRLGNPFVRLLRKPAYALLSRSSGNRYRRAATLFNFPDYKNIRTHIFSQEQYLFSHEELEKILSPGFAAADAVYIDRQFEQQSFARRLSPMELQALFDINYYLPDNLLTKVDRASMYYSLETRVPYLDHQLVEFAVNLSAGLKYRKGTSKYLLKKLLYTYLPEKLFRRPKQGFSIPLGKWLSQELRFLIDEFLNEKNIKQYGIVKYEIVESLKKEFLSGKFYLYNRLWALIILHHWLKSNN